MERMSYVYALCATALLVSCSRRPLPAKAKPTLFVTDQMIKQARAKLSKRMDPWHTAWLKVKRDAQKALDIEVTPYTGPDALKYRRAAHRDFGLARDLALVHAISGGEKYARKAAEILTTWAGSQPVPGTTIPLSDKYDYANIGLNLAIPAVPFCYAYALLYEHLEKSDRDIIETWLRLMAREITKGHRYWIDRNYFDRQDYNNHLSCHVLGLAATGFALRDKKIINYAVYSPDNPRDFKDMVNGSILLPGKPLCGIDPTLKGAQRVSKGEIYDRYRVVEKKSGRGCGLNYAFYHLKFLTLTAEAAYNNGIDLFTYQGPHGESLRLPFEYYADFLIENDSSIKRGYYTGNEVQLHNVFLYELAHRRYPHSLKIEEVLRSCDRVVYDAENMGWTTVLTHGALIEDASPDHGLTLPRTPGPNR